MNIQTAIEILQYHQEWRLGKRDDMIYEPRKLTQALDLVLYEVKKLQQHSIMQGPLLWKPYPSIRPNEYGDYFVYRAGKIHKETWNTSGWAYNENTISHWLEISGPSVGKAGENASVSAGM